MSSESNSETSSDSGLTGNDAVTVRTETAWILEEYNATELPPTGPDRGSYGRSNAYPTTNNQEEYDEDDFVEIRVGDILAVDHGSGSDLRFVLSTHETHLIYYDLEHEDYNHYPAEFLAEDTDVGTVTIYREPFGAIV